MLKEVEEVSKQNMLSVKFPGNEIAMQFQILQQKVKSGKVSSPFILELLCLKADSLQFKFNRSPEVAMN